MDVVVTRGTVPLPLPDLGACEYEMFPATLQGPAEYCPNEAEDGDIWCADHQPWEPDWDDRRKDALYECYD